MISNPAGNPGSLGGCVSVPPLPSSLVALSLSLSLSLSLTDKNTRAAGESDRSRENQPVCASAVHHAANWQTGRRIRGRMRIIC